MDRLVFEQMFRSDHFLMFIQHVVIFHIFFETLHKFHKFTLFLKFNNEFLGVQFILQLPIYLVFEMWFAMVCWFAVSCYLGSCPTIIIDQWNIRLFILFA